MKNFFNLKLAFAILLSFNFVNAQVPPNSKPFSISNYFYPDQYGNLIRYKAQGFVQRHTTTKKGAIYLLPTIEFDQKNIKYFNDIGLSFDGGNEPYTNAKSIRIPIKYSLELPNALQLPALGSALSDGEEIFYYVTPIRPVNQNSLMNVGIATDTPNERDIIIQSLIGYQEILNKQEKTLELYNNKYIAQKISPKELEITVTIDGEILFDKKFTGDYISGRGNLTKIDIPNPTLYQKNKISSGDINIIVKYQFQDSRASTIDAQFNAETIISDFLSETQQVLRKNKSSGWQVLGFGSRRKKLYTSINNTVRSEYNGSNIEGTSIEMFDATDDMIAQFENDFFPVLSKQKAIENHIKAASDVNDNETLKELHLKYASSLSNSDPDLETDVAGALASLAAQDYIGFIAKGVRWGSHTSSANSNFRRVVENTQEIIATKQWDQRRTVSVNRAVTQNVSLVESTEQHVYIGLANLIPFNYPVFQVNQYNQHVGTNYLPGLVISGVIQNSPADKAGLQAGMIISSIDDEEITSPKKFDEIMDNFVPGEELKIKIREYSGFKSRDRPIFVTLGKGRPKN